MRARDTAAHRGWSGPGAPACVTGSPERRAAPPSRRSSPSWRPSNSAWCCGEFTYEDAWALGVLLRALAVERGAPVAIDVRHGTRQVFRCALPGSSADNDAWIDRKRRVAERYAAPSFLVGARFRAKGTTFEESSRLDPDSFAAHGGFVPGDGGGRRGRGDGHGLGPAPGRGPRPGGRGARRTRRRRPATAGRVRQPGRR